MISQFVNNIDQQKIVNCSGNYFFSNYINKMINIFWIPEVRCKALLCFNILAIICLFICLSVTVEKNNVLLFY